MKYYSCLNIDNPNVKLPDVVSKLDYQHHVSMAVFDADDIIDINVSGTVSIDHSLYLLPSAITDQTHVVCLVIMDDDIIKIINAFPNDMTVFKRTYHVTVGTIGYDPSIAPFTPYLRSDVITSHKITGVKVEPFAPVKY